MYHQNNKSNKYNKYNWIFNENDNGIYQNIISKYFNGRDLKNDYDKLFFKLYTDHDGYDRDGPQSNLYDLVISYKSNGELIKDIWHREYWYQGEDNKPFILTS